MKVNVKLFASLKSASGTSQTTVDIEGSTVGDVIDDLIVQYGDKFKAEILEPDGNLRRYAKVFVNGIPVDRVSPLKNPVKEEDTLALFPPVLGG